MKIRLIYLLIGGLVLMQGIYGAASIRNQEQIHISSINGMHHDIHIAMLSTTPLGWDERAAEWYQPLLENYQWTIDEMTYQFVITPITDDDILNGELTIADYDVLLVPGGGVGDEQSIVKGTLPQLRPKVGQWKQAIKTFVEQGGGYVGYCGGTALACEIHKNPETLLEKHYDQSALDITSVKIYYNMVANFFSAQFRPDGWNDIGAAAYMFWSAYTNETEGYPYLNGVCFEISLNRSHPIYQPYPEDTVRVRWIGGPALVIPEDTAFSVDIGGWYPEEELVDNQSMRVHYWKYTGGIPGLLKGYIDAVKWCLENDKPLSQAMIASIDFAYDWEPTTVYVDINQSGKPCMATEIYPNQNQARIVLSTLHPERNVWWKGHVIETVDTDTNCLADGIYQIVDYIPFDQTPEDEITHTWWMVRREIAWAGKISNDHLPPIS